ncbi:MAG: YihY/virulence factor BrkB family protein [Acidimicrobiales bacterium]
MKKLRAKLSELGERWPWLGTALAVQERYSELNGNYLATAVTLAGFLSLFPLLLVAIAVVGFFSDSATRLADEVVAQLGLTGSGGQVIRNMIARAQESRRAASVVGFVGLLWSGLGLVAALQYAVNTSWQVTGRGLKDKLRGMGWLAGATVLFVGSLAIGAALNFVPFLAPVAILLGLGINFALWLWTFKVLGNSDVGWKALVSGAVLGAVGLEILKLVGSVYVPRAVQSASSLYGPLGVVFAILAWLLFLGRLVVYSSVLNVVRWEEEHGTATIDIEVPRVAEPQPEEATRAGETRPPVPFSA